MPSSEVSVFAVLKIPSDGRAAARFGFEEVRLDRADLGMEMVAPEEGHL
jgi:hypothetical protein